MTQQTDQPTELALERLEAFADNLRRRARDGAAFKQLVDSVKSMGVLEPLLVTPNGEKKYRVVAGNRRLEAARDAGLKTVPVYVRELNDQQVTEAMLIENLQRTDLLPTEEATGYMRLVELGMTQKDLAKRIGRTQSHVSDRLHLLDLPPAVRTLIDRGEIPIGAAEHLLKLGSREAIESLVKENPYDYERAVRTRLEKQRQQEQVAKARELAEKAGVPVIELDGYSIPGNSKMTAIGDGWDELKVDKKAHRKEPCHAIAVLTRQGRALPVCTDPKRHAAKGPSDLKVPAGAKAGRTLNETEKKRRAKDKEKKERAKARREAARGLLKNKLQSDAAQMALKTFVLDANMTQQKAVCGLVGIDVDKDDYSGGEKALQAYMDGPANVTRAATALCFVLMDERNETGAVASHVTGWLKDQGVEA